MNRDPSELTTGTFDVLVVGGGALGAWTAREAALQGWRTALIEASDFASGASWNNLKIVHGGLRYLQRLDFARMREAIRERSHLLRVAPHLVHPLPVLVPSFSCGRQRRFLLEIASRCNDLVSWDRNRGLAPERHLPPTRVLSRSECLDRLPVAPPDEVTGGIVFHDAQLYAPERLVLEVVKDAVGRGVTAANYVECRALRDTPGPANRIVAIDHATDERLEIEASCVVNATGSSAVRLARELTGDDIARDLEHSAALNLLLDPMGHDVAFALPATRPNPGARVDVGERQLLFVPWRGHTLMGTGHYAISGDDPPRSSIGDEHVEQFLQEIRTALPGLRPDREDVRLVHSGFLPAIRNDESGVELLTRGRVYDHARTGRRGLFSAVSVKLTTCRALAERILRSAAEALERPFRHSGPRPRLRSAPRSTVADTGARIRSEYGERVDGEVAEHLARTYGSDGQDVLALSASVPGGLERLHPAAPVVAGQILYASRHEMAHSLEDVLQRRTELGPRGLVVDQVVRNARTFVTRIRENAGG